MKNVKLSIIVGLILSFVGISHVVFSQKTLLSVMIPTVTLSGHTGWVTALAWSPDGIILASSSGDYTADDYTVRLWDADGNVLAVVDNSARTYSLDWSPDGMLLATGTEDGRIVLLDSDGMTIDTLLDVNGIVYSLDWSPDGDLLAAGISGGTSNNQVQVWSRDGQLLQTLLTNYSGGKFYNVSWSPDGNYLVGGAIDYTLWNADGTLIFTHEKCQYCTPAWGLSWSPDSRMWAVGDENGTVYVYSTDGELVAQLQSNISVDALSWSPDGQILAGGNSLWYWNGETFERYSGTFNGRSVIAWSPNGQLLSASISNRQQTHLANREGHIVALMEVQSNCFAWSPDGQILATGSEDTMIYLWDVVNMQSE